MKIELNKYALNYEYWNFYSESTHYTGHAHYRSPYESDDNCGTCDGARCDTCRIITDPGRFECAFPSNILENILIGLNIPKDIVKDYVYDDSCTFHNPDYTIIWPDIDSMKDDEECKEFYNSLMHPDEKMVKMITDLISKTSYPVGLRIAKDEFTAINGERYVELIYDSIYLHDK